MQILDIDNLIKYQNCMNEIVRRDLAIREILNENLTTSYPITNIEFMALQLRKILELIALANLVANIEQYEKARKSFMRDWNPKRIIDQISSLNDKFYPISIIRETDENGDYKWKEKQEGILTKEDYFNCLNFTSELLHAKNPFSLSLKTTIEEYKISIFNYISKIAALLNEHIIYLVNGDILNCIMRSENTNKAHAIYFKRIGAEVPHNNL